MHDVNKVCLIFELLSGQIKHRQHLEMFIHFGNLWLITMRLRSNGEIFLGIMEYPQKFEPKYMNAFPTIYQNI